MYTKKDYSNLKDLAGLSNQALDIHRALYEGYVTNVNKELEALAKLEKGSTEYNEVKRRLGWEFGGMRLHEYYFENLGGNGEIGKEGKLGKAIADNFGSFEEWKKDFQATGKIRGIGWAALYQDRESGKLINFWINEHDGGHPAGADLLLIMDVFEHAYFLDYKSDRSAYIEAFFKNINWQEVKGRLK